MITSLRNQLPNVAELCRRYSVCRLELFGSATSEQTFDPDSSDLDLVVAFDPGLNLGPWLRHYFEFRDALQALFGRSVDLVMHSAIKDGFFRRELDRTRRVLYASEDAEVAR